MVTPVAITLLAFSQGTTVKSAPTIKEEVGFIRATFTSSKGTITVILPSDIAQGDTISGTYFPDAKSKDITDLQIDLGTSHGPPEVANSPRRVWTVPLDAGPRLSLTVWTPDGVSFGTTYVNVEPKRAKVSQFTIPSFLRIGAAGVVTGPFDGIAENTLVKASGVNCAVVAESPRSSVMLVPSSMKLGMSTLELTEQKMKGEAQARMLGVQISSPKASLTHGEVSSVTLKVDGLMGVTDSKLPMVILENLTPTIIDLDSKVKHYLIAKPLEDGTYSKTLSITSLLGGKFAVSAVVDPGSGTKVDLKPIELNRL
jgi:hypothetical protein